MKSKQIFFFATKEDLIDIVEFIESNYNIKYAEVGLMDVKKEYIYSLIDIIKSFEIRSTDWNLNKKYILLPKNVELYIREVPQKRGGIKYAVDQMMNEDSIVLSVGGVYKNEAIIASKIGTISDTAIARDMIEQLSKFFKKYKNAKGFYICPEALKKSEKGVRLTTDASSSSTLYDLKII